MKMSIARVAPVTVLLGGCNACEAEELAEDRDDEAKSNRPAGSAPADQLSVVYLDRGRIELVRVVRPASWHTFARLSSSRLVCAPAPPGCRLKS